MRNKMKMVLFVVVAFVCLGNSVAEIASAQQTKRPFTVADEIGLTLFVYQLEHEAVQFSPDGDYFAVYGERGRVDLNSVEDSLRFYRSQDVKNFLERSDESKPPSPVWTVNRSDKKGQIINEWHWLMDSSGVAFLERSVDDDQRLVVADLREKTIEPLTSPAETVNAFDIRDRNHYVYTASDVAPLLQRREKRQAAAIVGTGRSLSALLFPDDPRFASKHNYLVAVVGGKRLEVKKDGAPLVPAGDFALSPDGQSLVAKLTVPQVPVSWETLYPPPFASTPRRIHAGPNSAHQYVRINLQTGSVQSLTDAPTGIDADWWTNGSPSWSRDGEAIILPGTFLSSQDLVPSRPCVAVVDLLSDTRTCLETLKARNEAGFEEGYHTVEEIRFVRGDKQRIVVTFAVRGSVGTTEYRRRADGTWQVAGQSNAKPEVEYDGLRVDVDQSFNKPPLLIAASKEKLKVIWDPNPQLKNLDFGEAVAYKWKDKEGREWEDGLYKPVNFKPGQRYPLVIQAHGFERSEFRPSGVYPTATAAEALTAQGIMVLQVAYHCPTVATPQEVPCMASNLEAAANQLISDGLADPERIGIIGFSRTCLYVMEMLTTGSLHLKAASITDGVMLTYSQFLLQPERLGPDYNLMIGAPPFGEGLQQWLKRSPSFNLDKINAPLLVVGEGPESVLFMWEPYAGLHYLKKPVDLIVLNTDEHVLTNPAIRLASQGGSVDWFRFWLKNDEDPDPAKAEQYKRWRDLRKMQAENEKKSAAPQLASN